MKRKPKTISKTVVGKEHLQRMWDGIEDLYTPKKLKQRVLDAETRLIRIEEEHYTAYNYASNAHAGIYRLEAAMVNLLRTLRKHGIKVAKERLT